MNRWIMCAVAAALPLAACTAPDPGAQPSQAAGPGTAALPGNPPPPATTAAAGPSEAERMKACAGDKVRGWVGATPTDDVKARIAAAVGDRNIRYYADGDPITMDFSEDRLNAVLGADGRIRAFRCG